MGILQALRSRLTSIPVWRRWLYVGLAVCLLVYLTWAQFGPKPPAPGVPVAARVAPAVAGMPQKTVTPRRVVVFADGPKVAKKLGVNPPTTHEEVQLAVEIPRMKHGGTAVTFLNVSSGRSRTDIVAAPAPWFSFERGSSLGVGYGIGTEGQTGAIRYRRDTLQVKGVYLVGEAEVNYATARSKSVEAKAMGWLEYRW